MKMNDSLPEFGNKVVGAEYKTRPGSYGLIFDEENRLLTLVTSSGLHLPGGGRDGSETAEENLVRELDEECQVAVKSVTPVTSAVQYVYARGEGYFKKVCDYFWVEISSQPQESEDDHKIVWATVKQALTELSHESHRYGLQKTIDLLTD